MDDSLPFFGRVDTLATLRAQVARRRIVQVVGPAGVGKSRLALEFAERLDHPALFVELADAASSKACVASLASALSVRLESLDAAEAVPALADALAEHGAGVVILDNIEQLIGVIEPALIEWSRAVRCVLTSRHRLPIRGAVVVEVPPLPAADARALLADRRARQTGEPARPDVLDDALLDRLDRLPLAIELASRWFAVQSPAAVIERFEREAVDAPMLRRSLGVSWALLTDTTRRVLGSLCLVRADVGVASIAPLHPGVDVPAALRALMDAGLVRRSVDARRRARFRPFATVRAFCLSQITAAERDAWTTGLVEQIEAELPRTLEWLAFSNVWHSQVLDRDRGVLDLVWAAVRDARSRQTIAAALQLCQLLLTSGPADLNLALADAAVAAAEHCRDHRLRAWSLYAGGYVRWGWRSREEALAWFDRAQAVARQIDDTVLQRAITRWQLNSAAARGDAVASLVAQVEAQPAPSEAERAERAQTLAAVYLRQGDHARAGPLLRTALIGAELADSLELLFVSTMNLGFLANHRGHFAEALRWRTRGLEAAERSGNPRSIARARIGVATVHVKLGQAAAARAHLHAARSVEQRSGRARIGALIAEWLGAAALLDNNPVEAVAQLDAAVAGFEALAEQGSLGMALGLRGIAQQLLGRPSAADLMRGAALRQDATGAIFAALVDLPHAQERVPDWLVWTRRCARLLGGRAPRAALVAHLVTPTARHFFTIYLRLLASQRLRALDGSTPGLAIDVNGHRFELAGEPAVALRHRPILARLLDHLGRARLEAPGRWVPVDDLVRCGWPDTVASPVSMRKRLQTNVYYLRQTGLEAQIESSDAGYRLSLAGPVTWSGSDPLG